MKRGGRVVPVVAISVAVFGALALGLGLTLQQNWDAMSGIGQMLEAIIVLFGGSLIFWQLRQMQTEEAHKEWEALQWAMDLVTPESVRFVLQFIRDSPEEITDTGDLRFNYDRDRTEEVRRFGEALQLISLAIEGNYLSPDLFFKARARYLVFLAGDEIRGKAVWKLFIAADDRQRGLIESAMIWAKENQVRTTNVNVDSLDGWNEMTSPS